MAYKDLTVRQKADELALAETEYLLNFAQRLGYFNEKGIPGN